tara:strand:+ start:957 stop:1190 length:234 start_codon:yes stop_codon:yes gene_type:complete
MEINIQNTKIELIQWLTTLEDKGTLEKLLALRKSQLKSAPHQLSQDEKKSVELGLEDSEDGKIVSHQEAKKVYEKWL